MKKVHQIAKGLEGDYRARMSLALRQAWKEEKGMERNEVLEMKRIPISKKAIPFTRRNSWTEKYSGEAIVKVGTVIFHNSISEIKEFYPVMTCFSLEPGVICDGPIYALIFKKDTIVSVFDDDEVRLDLDEHRNDVEIYYAGYRTTERKYDEFGRVLRFGGAKKVLHMEPEFENVKKPELKFVSRT